MRYRASSALAIIMSLFALLSTVASAEEFSVSGQWEFIFLGHRLSARMEHREEAIEGVAYLYNPGGKVDTYHFNGSLKDRKLIASHYSGHTFQGEVVSLNEITGVLRTKNGEEMSITLVRR